MLEYWMTRADQLKIDIDHVKQQIKAAREYEEAEYLKELKQKLTDELMIALEAVDKFKA